MGNIIQRKVQENAELPANSSKKELRLALENSADVITKSLPAGFEPERFNRIILSAFSSNPGLAECDKISLIASCVQAASLGLEPNTQLGQCYIIPYREKGKVVAQFQLGYRGLVDLAYRNDKVKTCKANIRYEKDEFDMDLGTDAYLKHKPYFGKGGRGSVAGYYAIIELVNGGKIINYMSYEEMLAFKNKNIKMDYVWKSHFDAMAMKTVLKHTFKFVPRSLDNVVHEAISEDGGIKDNIGGSSRYDYGNEENSFDTDDVIDAE